MIDLKRLKNDTGYWSECGAPEDATHMCNYGNGAMQWMKANPSGAFHYFWNDQFSDWQGQELSHGSDYIVRPRLSEPTQKPKKST